MADLDGAIRAARTAQLHGEVARRYVEELDRGATPQPPRRRAGWWPAVAGVAVLAAAVAIITRPRTERPSPEPVAIGSRVAIVADPGTAYQVVTATDHEARIV